MPTRYAVPARRRRVRPSRRCTRLAGSAAALLGLCACGGSSSPTTFAPPPPPPPAAIDLATVSSGNGFSRLSGSASTGRFGVPVAAGFDCDGDGFSDIAMSNMQAAPFGRSGAGQVLLYFGGGTTGVDVDTAQPNARLLTVAGAAASEAAGGEIWMDDLTGDGVGDLIVGRFNYREPLSGRIGAGAISVVVGGAALRDLAQNGTVLDLAAPPPAITVMTFVGARALDRVGFWMRTGDVSGDGIADLLFGADQADSGGQSNSGEAWLARGGAHINAAQQIDLADFGQTPLAGHLVKLTPPAVSADYHFGATVAIADLDANGMGEVLIAASLSRVGGLLVAAGAPADSAVRRGGNVGGSLFVFWDDNFPVGATWPVGLTISAATPPGSFSRIDGGTVANAFTNERFAEEMIGGLDYDGDGTADLFTGDIQGDAPNGRVDAGVGHVFFDAASPTWS